MKDNIGQRDRWLRIGMSLVLFAFSLWQHSLLAFLMAVFTLIEGVSGWCIMYQFLGINTCPVTLSKSGHETNMLDSRKLGLAGGILSGIFLFIFTIISMYTSYAPGLAEGLGQIFPGYGLSWSGAVTGLFYGFLNAFIALYLLGWIYNKC